MGGLNSKKDRIKITFKPFQKLFKTEFSVKFDNFGDFPKRTKFYTSREGSAFLTFQEIIQNCSTTKSFWISRSKCVKIQMNRIRRIELEELRMKLFEIEKKWMKAKALRTKTRTLK